MQASLMNLAWGAMVRITNVVNSSNFNKLKFVKVLNQHGVAQIVANTSQTYTSWLTNCSTLDLRLFASTNSNDLEPTIACANTIWCCLCVFKNIFLPLLNEKLLQSSMFKTPSMLDKTMEHTKKFTNPHPCNP